MSVPQLTTPEPTPVVKTGNRQVSVERKLAADVSVSKSLTRCSGPEWDEILRWIPTRPVLSVHEEEEESARGETSDSQ